MSDRVDRLPPGQVFGCALEPLPGGGQALGTRSGTSGSVSFGREHTVTVLGMPAIERLQPRKAQVIREAHEQAIRYLTDCREHLQSVGSASQLNAQTRRFLARVFSVSQIDDPLLDKLAQALEKLGGGDVAVIGHTDVRGSHAYNTALGLRRAKSVYDALAKRLSPEVRAKVRVDVSNDPTAPVGVKRK